MRSTAIGIGCGVMFFALVACVVIALVMRPDDVTVRGSVSISPVFTEACEDPEVLIVPAGKSARTVRFEASSWQMGQGCTLPVNTDVPKADSYRIEVPDVGVETVYPDASGDVTFDIAW